MHSKQLIVGAVALVLVACDGATRVTEPRAGKMSVAGSAASADGGASIVHGDFSTPSGTGLRAVTLHAVQTPSGQVNGGYRVELTATGIFFEVVATCVVTDGNTGWVAGIISATNSPAIRVGTVSYFYMIDNGKGTPTPDVVSTARFNDLAGRDVEFCTTRPVALPVLSGLEGDIRVK